MTLQCYSPADFSKRRAFASATSPIMAKNKPLYHLRPPEANTKTTVANTRNMIPRIRTHFLISTTSSVHLTLVSPAKTFWRGPCVSTGRDKAPLSGANSGYRGTRQRLDTGCRPLENALLILLHSQISIKCHSLGLNSGLDQSDLRNDRQPEEPAATPHPEQARKRVPSSGQFRISDFGDEDRT